MQGHFYKSDAEIQKAAKEVVATYWSKLTADSRTEVFSRNGRLLTAAMIKPEQEMEVIELRDFRVEITKLHAMYDGDKQEAAKYLEAHKLLYVANRSDACSPSDGVVQAFIQGVRDAVDTQKKQEESHSPSSPRKGADYVQSNKTGQRHFY